MSLLTLIQNACDLLSISRPTAVISSPDQQIRQLLAAAQEEGYDLAHRFDWQALTNEQTFTTVAQASQTGAVPADWDRFIPNSFFNRTTRRELIGPITPQQWQAIQAQPQLNRVYLAFRERDGSFLITPNPPAGQTIAFEYVSKNWCQSAGNVAQSAFLADTDMALLDEWIMTLGVRWRWRKAKGLEYAEDFNTYERAVGQKAARDQGAGKISTTGKGYIPLGPNLPEGDFPGPS